MLVTQSDIVKYHCLLCIFKKQYVVKDEEKGQHRQTAGINPISHKAITRATEEFLYTLSIALKSLKGRV